MKAKDIKKIVKENYGRIARAESSCCGAAAESRPLRRGGPTASGCGCGGAPLSETISKSIGYSDKDLDTVPDGANLGLGCGNPIALASLKPGEVVLDLGSGAGFDCFLAAQKVGPQGRVIGVDMTPEMLNKARANARKGNYANVEFRTGEIEKLPVDDASIDVIISNCVINLSPDKPAVFKEAFRVLKPGGRIMVSDIVLTKPLPKAVMQSVGAYVGCLAGATMKDNYLGAIMSAGFGDIRILDQAAFPIKYMADDPTAQSLIKTFNISQEIMDKAIDSVVSVKVAAVKP